MKRLIAAFVTMILFLETSFVAYAEEYKPYVPFSSSKILGNAYIPQGTAISCELLTSLNSGKNYKGERVKFKTIQDLVINNVKVIPQGTVGDAVVSDVSRAGAFGRGGRITIATKSLPTANGITVPVRFEMSKSGGGEGGWVVPAFLVVSVLAGFVRGKNQDLPEGTRFSVVVDNDTDLRVAPDDLQIAMYPPPPNKVENQPMKSGKIFPEIMTVPQAAEYLQTSPETVLKMIDENKIKATQIGDGWRLKKSDIDSLVGG